MSSIRESAEAYVPVETKNIADLDKVNTELEVNKKTFKEGTPEEFTINIIEVDGEEYRMPDTVLKQLKAIMEEKPAMTEFKVKKDGSGLATSYTVVPLD